MRTLVRNSVLAGVSISALASVQPAIAQQGAQSDQPSASSSGGLEEIVVTARRKEEKAQSVPIAISNVTTTSLTEQRILTPSDVIKDFTGFTTLGANRSIGGTSVAGGFGNGYQWIRGVAGVVAYWADSPTISNAGLLFDVGSVQLLKGPQGTLFGQATNGGAILYQPRLPTNVFEGYVEAEVGDYGHTRLDGVVNVPVVDDKLLVRVGGRKNHTDGFVYDIAHKVWDGSENNQAGRLAVTLRPFDSFQNDFVGNAFQYNEIQAVQQAVNVYTLGHGGTQNLNTLRPYAPCNSATGVVGGPAATAAQVNACIATYSTLGWYAVPGDLNQMTPLTTGWVYNLVDTARWDVTDNITLKNIASYTENGTGTSYAPSNVALNLNPSAFNQDFHSWPNGPAIQGTEEFQILGKALDDKLSYSSGVFYVFNQGSSAPHVINIQCSRVSNGATNTLGFLAGGTPTSCSANVLYSVNRSQALYAQGTYDLSDFLEGLSFTAGYRYTWDKVYANTFTYGGVPESITGKPQQVTSTIAGFGNTESSHAGSYTMSLDWQVDATTLLYITDSKGYSHGGVNTQATIPPQSRNYSPESLNNIELGIKADWNLPYEMRARTNVSGFYGLYDQAQVQSNISFPDVFGNPATSVVTTNAASGHVDGIDAELTLLPTDKISLSLGFSYVDMVYDDYPYCAAFVGSTTVCQPGNLYNLTQAVYPQSAARTGHARVAYTLPIDESLGRVTMAMNFTHVTAFYSSVGPLPPPACPAACPTAAQLATSFGWPKPTRGNINPETNQIDLSVIWTGFLGRPGLDAHAYVNNLTNAHWGPGTVANEDQAALKQIYVAQPRNFGFGLKYAFGP